MPAHAYILRCSDGCYYYGSTNDLRLKGQVAGLPLTGRSTVKGVVVAHRERPAVEVVVDLHVIGRIQDTIVVIVQPEFYVVPAVRDAVAGDLEQAYLAGRPALTRRSPTSRGGSQSEAGASPRTPCQGPDIVHRRAGDLRRLVGVVAGGIGVSPVNRSVSTVKRSRWRSLSAGSSSMFVPSLGEPRRAVSTFWAQWARTTREIVAALPTDRFASRSEFLPNQTPLLMLVQSW